MEPTNDSELLHEKSQIPGFFSNKVVLVDDSFTIPKITCSPHLWPLLIHLGMKVLAISMAMGSYSDQATWWMLSLLVITAECVYLRIWTARRMIGLNLWTVVTPQGKLMDLLETTPDLQDKLGQAPSCSFPGLQLISMIVWAVLGIIYIGYGQLEWFALAIFGVLMSWLEYRYFSSLLLTARQHYLSEQTPKPDLQQDIQHDDQHC